MPIPAAVSTVLVQLLNIAAYHLGERLAQAFQGKSSPSTAPVEQVKSDPRYVQAQVEYLHRKESRDKDLLTITAAQAEKRLQLQEQELQDRRELSVLQRELMRELQAQEIQVKLTEIQTLWDKDTWFSNLSRQETEQILQRQQHRLLILISPPKISEDCPTSFRNNLEIDLRSVGTFLNHHYPQQSQLCPVEFYSDYFKRPISDIDVKRLQTILAPVPTAILYSDISDYEVNFRVGFWGVQDSEVFLFPTQAWNWEQAKEELEADGENEIKALRIIRQLIVIVHKLLAAFLADLYYLKVDSNYEPQLFSLASDFPHAWLNDYIKILKNIQAQQQEAYEQELQNIAEQEAINQAEIERKQQEAQAEAAFREEELRLKAQKWRCIHTLTNHSDWVNCVAISPTHEIIASGSHDKSIKIWNLQTGQEIRTLKGHSDHVHSVAFSPDGQILASTSFETIKLWDLKTGQNIATLDWHSNYIVSVAFSPDGQILASSSFETIKLWYLKTKQEITILTEQFEDSYLAVNPYGQAIFAISIRDNTYIKVWNLKTEQEICTITDTEQLDFINLVAISSDGWTIALIIGDSTIQVWDLRNQQKIHSLVVGSVWFTSLAFSPDEKVIVSASKDDKVKIWNLKTGQAIHTLTGHSGSVTSIAISRDGQTIASGSWDNTVKIWRCDQQGEVEDIQQLEEEENAFEKALEELEKYRNLQELMKKDTLRSFLGELGF
jgi:DNA-binding beta-propeller fold protein YncE